MADKKVDIDKKVPLGVEVKGFILLNGRKVQRAFDELGEGALEDDLLSEYDKYGGAIKTKDGRKLVTGCFYDFVEGKAKKGFDNLEIEESSFEDEYVLVPKKKKKKAPTTTATLSKKVKTLKKESKKDE